MAAITFRAWQTYLPGSCHCRARHIGISPRYPAALVHGVSRVPFVPVLGCVCEAGNEQARACKHSASSPRLNLSSVPERSHRATDTGAKNMLLSLEIKAQLRRNFELSQMEPADHRPAVKLFTPDANATWLFSELGRDGDTLFGLSDLGHGSPELGYSSLAELSFLRGRLGLLVERDRHFTASKTLSQYADDAFRRGSIVT